MNLVIEIYRREDGKIGWRCKSADNHEILANDASQGYEHKTDARDIATRLFGAHNIQVVDLA